MKTLRTIIVSLMLIGILSSDLWAAPRVLEIMEKMDAIDELDSDISVKVIFTEHRLAEGTRVLEGVYYRRDRDDAFLLVMTAPDYEKGNGYLRIGNNTWMYRRNTRTFQIIKRDQSIAHTNAKAGDIEKPKFTDLYEPALDENGNEILSEETLGRAKIPVYRFEIKAKVKDVEYPKVVYWVRRDTCLKLKKESYSLSGTLMKTSYYPKYTMLQKGKYIALKRVYIDEFEKGNKTIFDLSGFSLEKIDDAIFTKAYLENLSK